MTMQAPFKRLFIANRGEIARRIATTAKRLGIEVVAITDRSVQAGPPAYLLGLVTHFAYVEEESPALYLDADRMIALALAAHCDCLHPGFGFLSENAQFAQKVIQAGLTWIGPHPEAINAMASKATARELAERSGVPCIRGLSDFNIPTDAAGDWSKLERFATEVGFPLLMKAALGGGGKGMRLVHRIEDLREAALRAHSEAKNSFGDGSLICEQYLTAPRHVEVQILADKAGQVFAIGDRDCSVQRRHQKVLEEAPAPGLTDQTRQVIHEAAVRLASAVGYDSTGTVEFLVDWSEASKYAPLQRFYFLEMNTRLQVEHPVTEEVFGLDLVEWQIRVAAGQKLPTDLGRLTPRGHSIEARLYAEDVTQNFFPAPGPVAAFRPAMGPGLRWETGLDDHDRITGRFDPMVAKLVATGETRTIALARMAEALQRSFFAGPPTNIELVHALITKSEFAVGSVTTHYLANELHTLLNQIQARRQPYDLTAKHLFDLLRERRLGQDAPSIGAVDIDSLTSRAFVRDYELPVRPSAQETAAAPAVSLCSSSQTGSDPDVWAQAGQGWYHCPHNSTDQQTLDATTLSYDGAFWYAVIIKGGQRHYWITIDGCAFYQLEDVSVKRRNTNTEQGGAATEICAPVPGKVVAIKIIEGQDVSEDTAIFILESMKMEFEVRARRAGRIATISVKLGEQVAAGQRMAEWDI